VDDPARPPGGRLPPIQSIRPAYSGPDDREEDWDDDQGDSEGLSPLGRLSCFLLWRRELERLHDDHRAWEAERREGPESYPPR
jgi:hypothetical protein